MGGTGDRGLGGGLVPQAPVVGDILRGFGVDLRPAGLEAQMHGQVVDLEHDCLGGIASFGKAFGNDHRDRLAHVPDAAFR